MTRRRWIADEVELGINRAALTGEHAEHLIRVLRARIGQEFDLVISSDSPVVRSGRIVSMENKRVVFELGEQVGSRLELRPVTLLLSIFKFDRMEWAIEKAVELGVGTIVPVIAARTQKHLATAATKKIERWRRIMQQAAEQARRESIAEIASTMTLKRAIEATEHGIVLAESEADLSLREYFERLSSQKDFTLAVGPEGGWTSEDLELFSAAGWQKASLGPNILRAETAAIAALAIVMSELRSS